MAKTAKPTDRIPLTLTRQEWNAIWVALGKDGHPVLADKIIKAVD